jgi:hypothetical protein
VLFSRAFHSTPLTGTTLPTFPLDSVRTQFQVTRGFPAIGTTSLMTAWNRWTRNAARLIRRHRHHVVSREPQHNRIYLFRPWIWAISPLPCSPIQQATLPSWSTAADRAAIRRRSPICQERGRRQRPRGHVVARSVACAAQRRRSAPRSHHLGRRRPARTQRLDRFRRGVAGRFHESNGQRIQ